jgi:single-strand DNA-binding protein
LADGLNRVMIIGNLGAEPEMRYTANGNAMTNFRIAVSRSYTHDGQTTDETEWFRVTTWNKLAELCSQFLAKGRKVYVEGRLSTRKWNKPDGSVGYITEVVASQVIFLDKAGPVQDEGDVDDASAYDLDDLPFS